MDGFIFQPFDHRSYNGWVNGPGVWEEESNGLKVEWVVEECCVVSNVEESTVLWGNVFVVDHDLAISVGTTELVEEAEQVHDELHNVGLGGITVQMDVLDAPKTAGQAVSRSIDN